MIYMNLISSSNKQNFWHQDSSSITCWLKKQEHPYSGSGMRNFPDSIECMIQTAGKSRKRTKIMTQTSTGQKYYKIHSDTVKI
jgi:hypothetical protein